MIKKIIVYIFLFSSIITKSQNNIKVVYSVGINNSKENKIKILKDVEFQLHCNSIASEFKIVKNNTISFNENLRFIRIGNKSSISYKNLEKKEHLLSRKRFLDKGATTIIKPFNVFDWKLTNESKKIGKYLCFKAEAFKKTLAITTGNKYFTEHIVVWYTPDIPVPFGPSLYNGLPGLVLEVKKNNNYLIAKEVKIIDKKLIIKRPVNKDEITEKEAEEYALSFIKKMERRRKIKRQ